jgi:hypothetical protein
MLPIAMSVHPANHDAAEWTEGCVLLLAARVLMQFKHNGKTADISKAW